MTETEKLLEKLTEEREAIKEPIRIQLTFELTVPANLEASVYKAAVFEALLAFSSRDIQARVWRLQFAPTRTTPSLSAEFT